MRDRTYILLPLFREVSGLVTLMVKKTSFLFDVAFCWPYLLPHMHVKSQRAIVNISHFVSRLDERKLSKHAVARDSVFQSDNKAFVQAVLLST